MSNLAQYWLPKDVVLMSFCSLFWCSDINRKWTLSRYKNIQMFYGMHTASGLFPITNIIFQIILYSGLVYAIWQPPALFSLFRICVSVFLVVCLFVCFCFFRHSLNYLFSFLISFLRRVQTGPNQYGIIEAHADTVIRK